MNLNYLRKNAIKKNCETALQEGTNQNIEEIKLKYVNVKGSISVLEKTK